MVPDDYDELKGIDWSWQSRPRLGGKTGSKPTNRAQKGVKRSLLTEGFGVPIGLAIDGANRHDCKMTKATIKSIPVKPPKPLPKPVLSHPAFVCPAAESGKKLPTLPRKQL